MSERTLSEALELLGQKLEKEGDVTKEEISLTFHQVVRMLKEQPELAAQLIPEEIGIVSLGARVMTNNLIVEKEAKAKKPAKSGKNKPTVKLNMGDVTLDGLDFL